MLENLDNDETRPKPHEYSTNITVGFFNDEFISSVMGVTDRIIKNYNEDHSTLPEYDNTHHTKLLFYNDIADDIPGLKKFLATINATVTALPIIGFMPPNSKMGIHVDGYGCSTKIMLPIAGDYPLQFYNDEFGTEVIETLKIITHKPFIFDTTQWHGGAQTTDGWRINFQIMLSDPFDVIKKKANAGELFTS